MKSFYKKIIAGLLLIIFVIASFMINFDVAGRFVKKTDDAVLIDQNLKVITPYLNQDVKRVEKRINDERKKTLIVDTKNNTNTAAKDKSKNNDTSNNAKTNEEKTSTGKTRSYKLIFENTLFVGDSVTDGLVYHKFMVPSNVLSKVGYNLATVNTEENINRIVNFNPENIILLFGLNDVMRVDNEIQYVERLRKFITSFEKKVPNAKIIIVGPTKVRMDVAESKKVFSDKRILKFNEALKEYCKKMGYTFINVNSIIDENPDIYIKDGMHFKPSFYEKYLEILSGVIE